MEVEPPQPVPDLERPFKIQVFFNFNLKEASVDGQNDKNVIGVFPGKGSSKDNPLRVQKRTTYKLFICIAKKTPSPPPIDQEVYTIAHKYIDKEMATFLFRDQFEAEQPKYSWSNDAAVHHIQNCIIDRHDTLYLGDVFFHQSGHQSVVFYCDGINLEIRGPDVDGKDKESFDERVSIKAWIHFQVS